MAPGPAESVQKIAGDFRSATAPLTLRDRSVVFCDTSAGLIYRCPQGGQTTVFREASRPAALALDKTGRLLICEQKPARVIRVDAEGGTEVLADYFNGQPLGGPTGIACRGDGSVYFADGAVREDSGDGLIFDGIYRTVEGHHRLQLMAADVERPLGLAFSTDQRMLYVASAKPDRVTLTRYSTDREGGLGRPETLAEIMGTSFQGGVTVDRAGNVLATGASGVSIFSRSGDSIGTIRIPEPASGLTWGGDGSDLYVTAGSGVYQAHWAIGGMLPQEL